jgi:hypothetical protein
MRRQAGIAILATLVVGLASSGGNSGGSGDQPTDMRIASSCSPNGFDAPAGTAALCGPEPTVVIVKAYD